MTNFKALKTAENYRDVCLEWRMTRGIWGGQHGQEKERRKEKYTEGQKMSEGGYVCLYQPFIHIPAVSMGPTQNAHGPQ